MMATLKTSFGTFQGKQRDGVVQYLGIKYATLKDRLAAPEVIQGYGDTDVDATGFGPRPIAADACEYEQTTLIQQNLETTTPPPMSGLDCLNLNITVPAIANAKSLPVMLFIHGGGFIIGSNWWPQYDFGRLVKLSVELGRPVIGVGINYRIGVYGGLTSEELRRAGYPGNNSLRDQKAALQWVKKYIGGFGGDAEDVTVSGESAGAVSVLHQLNTSEPLFKRAISMSGTPIMLKPLPIPATEMAYATTVQSLGMEGEPVEERIEKLLTISPEELLARMPMTLPLLPFADGDIIPTEITFKKLSDDAKQLDGDLPGREWCAELMIGDAQHDGNVFTFMGLTSHLPNIASSFSRSLHASLSAPSADAVLTAYGITPGTSDDEATQAILAFATDIAYYAPALAYAKSWGGKAYYYHFNEPNPWKGPFEGMATHMLDAAFLFQNYNDKLDVEARKVARAFGKSVLSFANGERPWEEYDRDRGNVQTFGPSERSLGLVERNGWGGGRRQTLWKLEVEESVNLDELSRAWDLYLAGQ